MARPFAPALALMLALTVAVGTATPAAAQPRRAAPAARGAAPTAQADAEDVVTVARFMIELPVAAADEAQLRAQMVAQHDAALARDPHFFDDERAEARVIRRTSAGYPAAAYRARLWSGVATLLARQPAAAQPAAAAQFPLLHFVLARNPILVNNGDGTTVLRSDLLNVAFAQVLATHLAAGQVGIPTWDEALPLTQALERGLPGLWPRLSPADRLHYVRAEPQYLDFIQTVRFNPQGRAVLMTSARQTLRTPADAPRVAFALNDQSSVIERRREAALAADMHTFMGKVSRANAAIFGYGLRAQQLTNLSHKNVDAAPH